MLVELVGEGAELGGNTREATEAPKITRLNARQNTKLGEGLL